MTIFIPSLFSSHWTQFTISWSRPRRSFLATLHLLTTSFTKLLALSSLFTPPPPRVTSLTKIHQSPICTQFTPEKKSENHDSATLSNREHLWSKSWVCNLLCCNCLNPFFSKLKWAGLKTLISSGGISVLFTSYSIYDR